MRTAIYAVLGLFATCSGLYYLGRSSETREAQQQTAAAPAESDHDVLVRETKSTAKYAADKAISSALKAPSQAKFSDREMLRQEENYALVRATVDAPNSFGTMLRQRWCAIVRFEPPRGAKFTWSSAAGVWRCEDDVTEDAFVTRALAAGWPGAAEKFTELHPEKPAKAEKPKRVAAFR